MFHKILFKIVYSLKRPELIGYYNEFQKSQWFSFEQLKQQQEKRLCQLINLVYQFVPYYTKLFNRLNLTPRDIQTIKDLEKIPILTKKIIREHWQDLIPLNLKDIKYMVSTTGGSTGDPCKYRMSLGDYERGVALMYRGWTFAGYHLGDKVATMAGSSLIPTTASSWFNRLQEFGLNIRNYSSYAMSEDNLWKYFLQINKWQPKFIRGYASSIYIFAKFLQAHNLRLIHSPQAIITTAEKLFDNQRALIELVFGAKVFDTYGLNDGGVSSFECEEHGGMHIDAERAILEVVDDKNRSVVNQVGKILATNLYNCALPFIRYDTGDLGLVSTGRCGCGRQTHLLKEISGRVTDFLKLNDVIIGSPVLTVLMGKFDIEQYQIIQDSPREITCKLIKGKTYNEQRDEEYIRKSFSTHVGLIDIKFVYVDTIPTEGAKKYKFIINNVVN